MLTRWRLQQARQRTAARRALALHPPLALHLRRLLPRDASARAAAVDLSADAGAAAAGLAAARLVLALACTARGVSCALLMPRGGGLIRPEDGGSLEEDAAACG